MANIYSEQGITQTPTARIGEMSTGSEARQAAKIFDSIEDNFQKKAEEHQRLATELYENGSNIAIHQGLEEISRNPKFATNPEAFAQEADKMAGKIFGEIQNPEIKQRVMMNYELTKNPYVNRAYNNMYKMQNEEQEAQANEKINGYFDNVSLSLGNLMNNNYSVDDFMKLKESIEGIDTILNEKDSRGFDLLTPSEKRMVENRKKTILQHAVINGINSTPFNERIDLVNRIANGEFEMINGIRESADGKEYLVGGLESYLKPESAQYIKAYATGLKDRYDKLKSTDKRNTGLSDRQAMERAKTQTIYDLELPKELKDISKIKDVDDRTFSYLAGRNRAISLYKNQDIDDKTFTKYMQESVTPLIKDIESTEGKYRNWLMPNGAYRDGVDVINTLNSMSKLSNEEKAYLYTNLYDAMTKDNIDVSSTDGSDKNRAKDIATKVKQEYLELKNANLVGTEINKVLLGNDVIEAYKPKKEPTIAKPKWKIWVRNDGKKYKVLPDKNGEYTNDSVFIRIGE